jgi:lipoprotein NlpI
MRFPVLLLASAGAFLVNGGAVAQTPAPGAAAVPKIENMVDPLAIRVVPQPVAPKQSPDAIACANDNGKIDSKTRAAACGKLIDSGKWKGEQIAWAYANRCFALFELRSRDKALADCDKAIALNGKNAVAFQTRGMIEKDSGATDKALQDFDKAIELGAKNPQIFSDRGDLLFARGEADKALADYDRLVAGDGAKERPYIQRGGAYLAKGDSERAIADFDKAIQIAPADALAAFNLGVAHFLKGDKAKASEAFRKSLKLDPSDPYPAMWLFLAADDGNRRDELRKYSTKFSKDAWPWPVVRYDLGAIDAQKVVAAATTPGAQCEAQFYLGAERMAKNAKADAAAFFRKATEICPKNYFEYFGAVDGLNVAMAPNAAGAAGAAAGLRK